MPPEYPAGIGPEISLKAALEPAVRAVCEPVIVTKQFIVFPVGGAKIVEELIAVSL